MKNILRGHRLWLCILCFALAAAGLTVAVKTVYASTNTNAKALHVDTKTDADALHTNENTEADTEAPAYEDQPETEEPVSTENYELSDVITITTDQLTYKDASTGAVIDISSPIQTVYTPFDSALPVIDIYYGDTKVTSTDINNNRFKRTYSRQNPDTLVYEPYEKYWSVTPAGNYLLVIEPLSDYGCSFWDSTNFYQISGTITISYIVSPKSINDPDIVCEAIADQVYQGTPLCPNTTLSYAYGDDTLVPNVYYEYEYDDDDNAITNKYKPEYNSVYDYTVAYYNNAKAGMAYIVLTGVGNYTGTRQIDFKIFQHVNTLKYSGYKDTVYTGKAITFPDFTVLADTVPLTNGTDYKVSYTNNTKYGEATITVTGMGFYTGTYTLHFGIVPKKVTGISISSPKKLQAKITWKKCTGADGFEISRYNTKKKKYEVIAILNDGRWQVYQDAYTKLKNNVSYKYQIRPFVSSADGERKYYGAAATKKGKVTKSFKELNIPIYTGSADVDYAAEVICKKVIKKGMSQQQKVKALYDWVVDHCTHDKDYGGHKTVYSYKKNAKKAAAYDKKIWKQIFTGKADCNFDGFYYNCSYNAGNDNYWYDNGDEGYNKGYVDGHGQFERTYEAFQTRKGGCSYITRLFKALVNHAGLECTLVDGNFKNSNGTKMYHYWCFIRVNKKCAWYDVDIATSHKNIRYVWYKKGAKFWHTCHEWNPKNQPAEIPSYLN